MDETALKVGLLMESAQAHQKLAESQLASLRAHTQDLDGVVRDEIRRTLVEELQALAAETNRAAQALKGIKRSAARRTTSWIALPVVFGALVPFAVAHWVLPSPADVAALRARRDEAAVNLAKLEQQGGRIDWRHCGDARRLCVRVDRKAPAYGESADYFVLQGY